MTVEHIIFLAKVYVIVKLIFTFTTSQQRLSSYPPS